MHIDYEHIGNRPNLDQRLQKAGRDLMAACPTSLPCSRSISRCGGSRSPASEV